MYRVFKLPIFDKKSNKILNKKEIKIVLKIIEELKENPFSGKPLRYSFLREKRIKDKRIYYLIYENICIILLVSASDKKSQQETIDEIIKDLDEYKKLANYIHKKINTQ